MNFASVARTKRSKLMGWLGRREGLRDGLARRARFQAKLNMKLRDRSGSSSAPFAGHSPATNRARHAPFFRRYSRMFNFISRLRTDTRAAEEEISMSAERRRCFSLYAFARFAITKCGDVTGCRVMNNRGM